MGRTVPAWVVVDLPDPSAPVSEAAGVGYRPFVAGIASWFGAWGMQVVLFSWLVVGELGASAEWVGVAQTAVMAPSLLLLLAGGVVADRIDPRRLVIAVHLLATVPVLALAAVVAAGRLSLGALLAYGVCLGTASAFVMPARGSLLSRVAGLDLMRAVTGVTMVQFGAQALGTLAGGAASWIGSAPMLVLQACILVSGAWITRAVPSGAPPVESHAVRSPLREIAEGLTIVARTPKLRAPLLLVAAVGGLFIGPFTVVFPLLVRDYYQGSITDLSLVLMLFPLGTIAGSVALRMRGGLRRKGLALLVALGCGATSLSTIGFGLPFAGMMAATFVWGLCGSVFINSSRTLYQDAAPPLQRGRALAAYQLGFLGMAPFGSLASGMLAGWVGSLVTLWIAAGAMFVVVALAAALTDVASME